MSDKRCTVELTRPFDVLLEDLELFPTSVDSGISVPWLS